MQEVTGKKALDRCRIIPFLEKRKTDLSSIELHPNIPLVAKRGYYVRDYKEFKQPVASHRSTEKTPRKVRVT